MWELYRMLYKKVLATPSTSGIDTRRLDSGWTKTDITFKARNRNEAMKKAKKFWERGCFGMGSIDVEVA